MGKGKGKKGKREEKLAIRAAKKAVKAEQRALLPPGSKPPKKPKIPKVKKPNLNPPGPANFPIPTGKPKPFTKSPQGAKWPALFKKHLGVLEAHIRALDRVRQSMKSDMGKMEEDERRMWELGEKGNWRVICEMIDRARLTLASGREAAKGILPARSLKDKKGLGVIGTNFEPLGPQLAARAAELNAESSSNDKKPTDSEGDSEMSDTSSSGDEGGNAADFIPLHPRSKDKSSAGDETATETPVVDPNPYFMVDTNPTPVVLNGNGSTPKKSKKRRKEEDADPTPKKSKKAKKERAPADSEPQSEPSAEQEAKKETERANFVAVEAQLTAEIEAAEANKAEKEKKKEKKKRRRSEVSDGDEEVVSEKKVRKEKSEKKEKKEKKRKMEENGDAEAVAEDGGTKKKKRKHKAEADA